MFNKLEKKIMTLNNSCPDAIPMNISLNIDVPRAATLRECLFHRIKDLASGTLEECKQNRLISAMTLQRALMETESLFNLFIDKLIEAIKTKDSNNLKDFLTRALRGARSDIATKEFGRPPSTSVLTLIAKLDKKIPNYRKHYDFFSEFAHPNSAGVCKVYSKTDWNNKKIKFGNNREKIDIDTVANQLDNSLDWFIDNYDQSADLLDQFLLLSNTKHKN